MIRTSSVFKFTGLSVAVVCLLATPARAQSAGAGGVTGVAGASGGGGTPSGGSGGVSAGAGGASAGGPSAAAGTSGAASGNLVSNGTFETSVKDPWWDYSNDTPDYPAAQVLAVANGQLCSTMTAGGQNVWDVIVGLSGVALLPNQYYHISFTVTADAARTIKFKTGLGDAPYTDYFIKSVPITAVPTTATPQLVDYTYLNLRADPTAQFQFQIGKTPGTVCLDNIVLEPVAAPSTPAYVTPAPSHHPLKDYAALVKMGTAVDTPIFLSSPLHNAIVAGEFSMVTPANSMKMNVIQPTQGVFDFTDTDALVNWATANGLEFRGHPLVWHTQAPAWLTDGTFDRDQMIDIMYAHIDGVMGHYAGKLPYWDVVNEAIADDGKDFRPTIWHDRIGANFIDLAFTHARAADPKAKLFYNDYNIEQKGNAKADRVFEMLRDMKMRGIPIDGVGLQGHYFVEPDGGKRGVPNMQAIRDNMARYAEIGLEVQVTESDFRVGKPLDDDKTQVQKAFYADFLQACIDASSCSHFTVWGLSDLDSWVPSTFPEYDFAHLWDTNLMPKPAYFAMSEVFAKYNPDGTPLTPPGMGTGGSTGAAGGASGASGAGTPSTPSGSKNEDSGGCALSAGQRAKGSGAALVLSMLGMLLVRRRRARAAAR